MKAYIVDTKHADNHGAIHVFDVEGGEKLHTIESLYLPDVAVSPDGSRIFVCETDITGESCRSFLTVYDGESYGKIGQDELPDRHLYNVAPTASGLSVSEDGNSCYALQTEVLGGDDARFYVRTFDVGAGKFTEAAPQLPFAVTAFGPLAKRSVLHFALSGREGEACGIVDTAAPAEEAALACDVGTTHHNALPMEIAGSAAHPEGDHVYVVGRDRQLRIWNVDLGMLSEPIALQIPDDLAVPMQNLAVGRSKMYLGLGNPEAAARGQVEHIYVYNINGGVYRDRSLCVWPPSEKMALSPDEKRLLTLSMYGRSLTVMDATEGELVSRIEDVGDTPVAMVLVGAA